VPREEDCRDLPSGPDWRYSDNCHECGRKNVPKADTAALFEDPGEGWTYPVCRECWDEMNPKEEEE
jgi:hypothetical protein